MNAAPAPAGPWRDVDGIVLLDKPEGLTSNAALQRVRRACRAPLARFLGDWDARALYAFRKGFREGAWCLGCCWALMLLAFAAGVMNLAFMGFATLVMIAEKTALLGRRGSLALGLALCAAGALTLT